MKVIDAFTFFNELDLLEFRLRLLDDVVDRFVICESNYTHSGNSKPHLFEQNMSRYERWMHKITYLPIEQSIENLSFNKVDGYTPTDGSWILENQQRMALSYANELIADDDMVLVGDLDEIPDPRAIEAIKNSDVLNSNKAVALSLLFHYYYMNCQMEGYDRIWQGTVASVGDVFKANGPQFFRDNRNNFSRMPNAGWHFSYLGGPDKIKTKIESFAHTEFNRPDIKADDNILSALTNGSDIFKRNGISYKLASLDDYPDVLRDLMIEYPQFTKDVA